MLLQIYCVRNLTQIGLTSLRHLRNKQIDVLDIKDKQRQSRLGRDIARPMQRLECDQGARRQVHGLVEDTAVLDIQMELRQHNRHLIPNNVDVDQVEELNELENPVLWLWREYVVQTEALEVEGDQKLFGILFGVEFGLDADGDHGNDHGGVS